MAKSAEPSTGRPSKDDLKAEIEVLLRSDQKRAWTLGEIVPEVGGSRRTVQDRLDELVENDDINYEQIGNARAYWIHSHGKAKQPVSVFQGLALSFVLLFGFGVVQTMTGGNTPSGPFLPVWVEAALICEILVWLAHVAGIINLESWGDRIIAYGSPFSHRLRRRFSDR